MPLRSNSFLLVVAISLAVDCHVSHLRLNEVLDRSWEAKAHYLIPTPEAIKYVTLGYDQLIADCYWLSFIQYVGDTAARQEDRYQHAYEYLNLITSLDPYFIEPYWFAAFTVGSDQGRPRLAAELIERGIRANQNNWYLPYIAGINQYLFAHDEQAAARYYRMAAKFPGAPSWLERQSKILEARIPSLIKEVNTWHSVYESTSDPLVKERAREHLAATWMKVFRSSPSETIRKKAADALKEMGVEVH